MYSPRKLHGESVIFSKHYFSIENVTTSRCLVEIKTGIVPVWSSNVRISTWTYFFLRLPTPATDIFKPGLEVIWRVVLCLESITLSCTGRMGRGRVCVRLYILCSGSGGIISRTLCRAFWTAHGLLPLSLSISHRILGKEFGKEFMMTNISLIWEKLNHFNAKCG